MYFIVLLSIMVNIAMAYWAHKNGLLDMNIDISDIPASTQVGVKASIIKDEVPIDVGNQIKSGILKEEVPEEVQKQIRRTANVEHLSNSTMGAAFIKYYIMDGYGRNSLMSNIYRGIQEVYKESPTGKPSSVACAKFRKIASSDISDVKEIMYGWPENASRSEVATYGFGGNKNGLGDPKHWDTMSGNNDKAVQIRKIYSKHEKALAKRLNFIRDKMRDIILSKMGCP